MKINNIKFNIRIKGRGKPLIWGHGLTSSMNGEDTMNLFKWGDFSKDIQLIRYDARGHGRTQSTYIPDHYRWQHLAEDMTAIADALHLDMYFAGGQSMGCAAAIYAALRVPHRIKGLVLVTPPTAWEKRKAHSGYYNKMARTGGLLGGRLLAKLVSRRLKNGSPDWLTGAPEQKIKSTVEGLRSINRKTLSALFKGASLTDLPPREVLQALDMPALILAWSGDPGHPLEVAVELNGLLLKSDLVVANEYADVEKWPLLIESFVSGIEWIDY
jgi:pimeloyl-ACP methyl ester carboxylesterase